MKLFFFLILLVGCVSQEAASTNLAKTTNPLSQKISAIQAQAQIPGLQILVSERGQNIYEYAAGLRAVDQDKKITSNDKWHIGAITKPMTAFLIGKLIDQGKLSWTTTLEELAPSGDCQLHDSVKGITIENLLSHISLVESFCQSRSIKLTAGLKWVPSFFIDSPNFTKLSPLLFKRT